MKKISVCVLCYNHENFIADALESIVQQESEGFRLEIIVGDDLSDDRSVEICQDYSRRYPFIKVLSTSVRLGMEKNLIRVLKECNGDYVAFCDGDDYWTNKNKLAEQVSVLTGSAEVGACYHNVQILKGENFDRNIYSPVQPERIIFTDLMSGQFMKTCALLIRNRPGLFDPIIEGRMPADDTSLCFLSLENGGEGAYIDKVMAVYRVHDQGIWSMIQVESKLLWAELSLQKYIDYYGGRFNVDPLVVQLKTTRRKLAVVSFKKLRIKDGVMRWFHSFIEPGKTSLR